MPERVALESGRRTPAGRPARLVFLICHVVYTVFWTPYILREHFPALTLAEHGTLNVDEYAGWTSDIFEHGSGRAFINNNPGASIVGAAPLELLRPALERLKAWNETLPPQRALDANDEISRRVAARRQEYFFLAVAFVTAALAMAPLTAGVMAYLAASLVRAGYSAEVASATGVICGIGTPLVFRTGSLNHNLLVADAGFAALLAIWNGGAARASRRGVFVAGLCAGFALLCDYSAVVVGITAGVYALLKNGSSRWRAITSFAAGAAPGVLALLLYQRWAFGAFLAPAQFYMPAIAETSHGYRGFGWPSAPLALALLFDPRFGLFAYGPALIVAVAAPFVRTARRAIQPLEMWILALYSLGFLAFCSANQYSWLQPLTGFRYMAPVVPVLGVAAIAAGAGWRPKIRSTCAAASVAFSVLVAAGHLNDVRVEATGLWQRGFELVWMERLRDAGAPAAVVWGLGGVALAGLAWALARTAILFRAAIASGRSDR